MLAKISFDFIIFLVIIFTAYSGFRRGIFKEFFIALAYIPYITAMFYFVNEFIQGTYSFDSILLKISALGGFYIAYLIAVWFASKALKYQLETEDITLISISKVLATTLSALRTVYFCFLCLIMFNLHINNPEMVQKSKIASAAQPYALDLQNYLLSNGYIDNSITLYEDAINGEFDQFGKYEHPIMKKIKSSDKFKEMQEKINGDEIKDQINNYMSNQYR